MRRIGSPKLISLGKYLKRYGKIFRTKDVQYRGGTNRAAVPELRVLKVGISITRCTTRGGCTVGLPLPVTIIKIKYSFQLKRSTLTFVGLFRDIARLNKLQHDLYPLTSYNFRLKHFFISSVSLKIFA